MWLVTLGLWICKVAMQASPELVRFSMWPLVRPQCLIKKPGQISPAQNKLSVEFSKFRAKYRKRIIYSLSKYLLFNYFIPCRK